MNVQSIEEKRALLRRDKADLHSQAVPRRGMDSQIRDSLAPADVATVCRIPRESPARKTPIPTAVRLRKSRHKTLTETDIKMPDMAERRLEWIYETVSFPVK